MIKVLHSFNMAGKGYMVELQHNENGLPAGTLLVSEKFPHHWKVAHRIVYHHMINKSKILGNEKVNYVKLGFASAAGMEESAMQMEEQEKQNIFHYWIEKNEAKPEEGDMLEVVNNS